MPAIFRVLLLCGSSRALLRLLSGLLPSCGFSSGALLGLLGSDRPLSCGSFRRVLLPLLPSGGFSGGALLGLLGSVGLLPCGSFGGGTLLRLLSCGSFGRRTLLRCMIRRR